MPQSNQPNATGSALMRLPAEIRSMIVRMVIGDNLIHIYHCERGYGYVDGSEPDDGRECVLTHSVCHSDVTVHRGRGSASPNSISSSDLAHRNCANLSKYDRENYLDFRVFETNRQIHQEAFLIFWRTSRFAFEQGDVMTKFLGYLSEAQRHNLQNIVICHRFRLIRSQPESHPVLATVKSKWPSCFRCQAGLPSCTSLKKVELHLDLCRIEYGIVYGIDYLRTFRAHFKAFEPLRLLSLDEASVTVSVFDRVYRKPIQLKDEDLLSLEESFRDRLLNPTITKQDVADTLQDEIGGLEYSVRASESKVKGLLREVAALQAQADRRQLKVDGDRDQLHRLQTVLSGNNASEMSREIQLRTGVCLGLPGRDRDSVAES